jgi:MerR family transcriptional regulator/heat shock protein HspR
MSATYDRGLAADRPAAEGQRLDAHPAEARATATRAVYVISVAAELAGVHPQTLRIYERKGLLDPARTTGGTRRYSDADIARLRRIQELTNAGVNLEGVRRILLLERKLEALAGELERAEESARAAVDATHRQYRRELVPLRAERLPARWHP